MTEADFSTPHQAVIYHQITV